MIVVEDVRAIDNTASQTITSTCREEPEQIGWNKWHAKGEAGPLSMAHPARDMGLDVNPVPGSPFPTGGLSVCGADWQQLQCPWEQGKPGDGGDTTPPAWKYAEICTTSQTQGSFWSFKRKVKPFNQPVNCVLLFHCNKEVDISLHVSIQFISLDLPASNTKWSVKINLEEPSILPHLCSSDQCTSLSSPFLALQSNLL